MVYGYEIQSKLTYFRLLDDLYLSKNKKWRRVTARTAPVGNSFQHTLELANTLDSSSSYNDEDVPLVLTNLTIEYNGPITFIRKGIDDAAREQEERLQRERQQQQPRQFIVNDKQYSQQQQPQQTVFDKQEFLQDITSPPFINNDNSFDIHSYSTSISTTSEESPSTTSSGFKPRVISSYAILRNAISGYQLLTDKFNLTRNLSRSPYVVPCMLIEYSKITQSYQIDVESAKLETDQVWFLKDPLLNKSTGIELFKSIDDAIKYTDKDKRYILQREIKPLLINNLKFDVRINVLFVFSPSFTRLYMFNEGVIRCTNSIYKEGSLDKEQQFTNFCYQLALNPDFDNIMLLSDWDNDKSRFKILENAVVEIFDLFWSRLNRLDHSGFTLLGLDFIFDGSGKPYLLEINYSPSMFIQSNEKVASSCRKLIEQIPSISIEPLLEGKEFATDTDWNLLRREEYNTNQNQIVDSDISESEDLNLFA